MYIKQFSEVPAADVTAAEKIFLKFPKKGEAPALIVPAAAVVQELLLKNKALKKFRSGKRNFLF